MTEARGQDAVTFKSPSHDDHIEVPDLDKLQGSKAVDAIDDHLVPSKAREEHFSAEEILDTVYQNTLASVSVSSNNDVPTQVSSALPSSHSETVSVSQG